MQRNSKTLKIGILGRSNLPHEIVQRMEKRGMLKITGIHGTKNPEVYRKIDDFDDFLIEPEAVFISDLSWSDFATVAGLVKHSKHVYLENPCLFSNGEIRKVELLAAEAGVVVQLGLKHRYQSTYRVIRDFDLKPRIIECNRFLKFSENTTSISVISDLMMHDIDVVLTLAGSPVKSINATGVGVLYDDPDVVNARIEFYNGCIANLAASKISGKNVHKTRFFQNNSYYAVNFLDQSVSMLKNGSDNEEFVLNGTETQKPAQNADSCDIFAVELETFYRCIIDKTSPEASVADFLNTKIVADRIIDQLERNFKRK
jgi:predicted dehydrogenase